MNATLKICFCALSLAFASACQTTGDSAPNQATTPVVASIAGDLSWLNGTWESRTKAVKMDIQATDQKQLTGTAYFNYGSGEAKGDLRGRPKGDLIVIDVKWENGETARYEFRRQTDGSLRGSITEGDSAGRRVLLRKI